MDYILFYILSDWLKNMVTLNCEFYTFNEYLAAAPSNSV